MKATKIAGSCEDADCPAVYVTDEPGVVLAQGLPVHGIDGVKLGPGEMTVRLPLSILKDAVAALKETGNTA